MSAVLNLDALRGSERITLDANRVYSAERPDYWKFEFFRKPNPKIGSIRLEICNDPNGFLINLINASGLSQDVIESRFRF